MAGDVGFDPFGFSSTFNIKWLREAEVAAGAGATGPIRARRAEPAASAGAPRRAVLPPRRASRRGSRRLAATRVEEGRPGEARREKRDRDAPPRRR